MARANASNRRTVLCVFPRYEPSFGTFQYAYPLMAGVTAFMPPQGLLTIAAYLPPEWEVRFVDENIRPAREADFRWADAVLVSGMHVQRRQIIDIARRAHAAGRLTVLGGPSVSSMPEEYAAFDYLHIGELGDATDDLIARLDADCAAPPAQVRFTTRVRLPLSEFPPPAYHLVEMRRYFLASIQFSSGCPYQCEFCDIPALYGRQPRLKSPEQVVAELDLMRRYGQVHAVYFVDDNFIGNRKAAKELLPHLIDWQRRNGYPLEFACEATLNIAKQPELLELMREARFCTVFCGIETPELAALQAMRKGHNASVPMLEAIRSLNGYGIEVVSGIILGLDTDTAATEHRILDFVRQSQVPMLTINLLQALPRTPLHDRLQAEGRLSTDHGRESNVVFRQPYDEVLAGWRRLVEAAFAPEEVYARFAHNVEHTFPHRFKPEHRIVTSADLRKGLSVMARVLWHVGLRSDYRATFWRLAKPLIKKGRIDDLLHVAIVAHHLIRFARDAVKGHQNASFYSAKLRRSDLAAE
jgi:radical SAM superfamily enzyme YgiQ (UPF0313 family)